MRARATATVQSKIKTVSPPVREVSPARAPTRTPVKAFPQRSNKSRTRVAAGIGPPDMAQVGVVGVDYAQTEDPRLAGSGHGRGLVHGGGFAVALEEPLVDDELDYPGENDLEGDDLDDAAFAEAKPSLRSRTAKEAAASLAELEALVSQPSSDALDPRAMRDQVVVDHLPLVRAIAIRVHENLPVHVELDDLVHAGIMGLFDASGKYNPEKKVAFSSYAKHRIKGAILDSLRQLDWASRDLRRRHKQVEQVTRDLASTLHRNPTEAEIAAKMGVEVDRWRQMMLDLRNVGLVSASTRGSEHEDLPAPDFPSKPETQPDSMCAREQLRDMLAIAMKVLPERYQRVVLLYYTNELTMKEIGTQLGINESRVSQIHKSALEKMAGALQQAGIHSSQAF